MIFAVDPTHLHPSTRLGLHALRWLGPQAECLNILDMGCGSGVLSAASAHIWPARVLAADISAGAVADTRQVIEDYALSGRVSAVRSDRFAHPAIARNGPYDLIIANMLDGWLVEMATDMQKLLAPGGTILLSGMLEWLAPQTLAAYYGLCFELTQEFSQSPWRAALLNRKL